MSIWNGIEALPSNRCLLPSVIFWFGRYFISSHLSLIKSHQRAPLSHLKAAWCRVFIWEQNVTRSLDSKWHLRTQSNQYYSENNQSSAKDMFYSVCFCVMGPSMALMVLEMGNLEHSVHHPFPQEHNMWLIHMCKSCFIQHDFAVPFWWNKTCINCIMGEWRGCEWKHCASNYVS